MISREICQRVLGKAVSTGADYAELFAENTVNHNISMIDSRVESIKDAVIAGAAVRVYKGLRSVMATTVDTSEAGLMRCAEAAADALGEGTAQIDIVLTGRLFGDIHPIREVPGYESFESFGLTAGDLKFSMCKTPDKENWDRKDLEDSDYKTTFAIGESASFVVKRPKNSEGSEKSVKITYVIRTADGSVVSIEEAKFVWDDLWNKRYCELVLPAMPDAAGDYSIDICFNGKLACTQEFIITAE